MSVLKKIIDYKIQEVKVKKEVIPLEFLKTLPHFTRATTSLSKKLNESNSGIIAEHKRRSPSKPMINTRLDLPSVIASYSAAGACGISVLTDIAFFGGSLEDLLLARTVTELPLLRKDFIIDQYQVAEAKAYGADVILLIAAVLSPHKIKELVQFAHSLGLEVLLEVHGRQELEDNLKSQADLLGVNNRNLKTFDVSLEVSINLAQSIPDHMVGVSESGIESAHDIRQLRSLGYKGFLVGTHFMTRDNPGEVANLLINAVENES